jgi:integrase
MKVPTRQGVAKVPGHGASKPHRLVATRVAILGPGTYTDPGQTGLQLRVYRKRSGFTRTWLLRFKFRGEETRIVLGHFPDTTLDAARALARKYRGAAAQGIDPRRARPKRRQAPALLATAGPIAEYTIEHLAHEFMERHIRPKRKRPEYVRRILDHDVLPVWAGRDARSIEPHEVIELLDKVVDRGAPVQANRVASILTQLFKFGIHRRIVPTSPVQLLYRPGGKEKPRDRALSDEELGAFLRDPKEATRFERLSHVLMILLLTGQRRGELALARWAEIDFKKKQWLIPAENSKTGKAHVVPLTEWAVREFETLKALAKGSRFVVPSDEGDAAINPKLITRGVARCQERMKKLGIARFSAHDLRRTVRTGLARLKIAPHIAERVLNHAQERIPGTYDVHDYLEEKREALEKWATRLEQLRAAQGHAVGVPQAGTATDDK